jgi:hypothetical protein
MFLVKSGRDLVQEFACWEKGIDPGAFLLVRQARSKPI